MIKLINVPKYRPGGLWFEITANLQLCVIPWLKSKLHEVSCINDRKAYRSIMTKRGLDCKYSQPIHAESSGSYFDIYALYGGWRVGDRGIQHAVADELKGEILRSIEAFFDITNNCITIEAKATPKYTLVAQI